MRSPSRRGQGFVTCVGNAIKKTPVVGVGGMTQRLRGMGRGFVEWVEALWNVSSYSWGCLWGWFGMCICDDDDADDDDDDGDG